MSETFGDVVIRILYTIIDGILGTTFSVVRDILLLFSTLSANSASISPLALVIGVLILAVILFGIFRLFKGQIKPLIIAAGILGFLLLMLLFI